jgi:hypothetical protein
MTYDIRKVVSAANMICGQGKASYYNGRIVMISSAHVLTHASCGHMIQYLLPLFSQRERGDDVVTILKAKAVGVSSHSSADTCL